MDGDDEGNAVVQLGEDAAEVGIPCVAMHDAGVDVGGIEIEATLEGAEDGLELFRRSPAGGVEAESVRGQLTCGGVLVAEAADIHRHELGEFAAEVFDMHSGAAVDVGWIFVGEEQGFHGTGLIHIRRQGMENWSWPAPGSSHGASMAVREAFFTSTAAGSGVPKSSPMVVLKSGS